MEFEWDEKKARSNLAKHRVSFDIAKEVFSLRKALIYEDSRFDYGENRNIILGEVEGVLLYVVYTIRFSKTVDNLKRTRIISARKATKGEVKKYNDHIKKKTA